MNGVASIKEMMGLARQYLDAAIQETDAKTLGTKLPGATVGPIGEIYGHTVSGEDWAFSQLIQGKDLILTSGGWAPKLGLDPDAKEHDWNAVAQEHMAELQAYGKAVTEATDAFLDGISDADLDRPIDFFGRKESMGWVIADTVLVHVAFHSGEIASLKGVMGQRGLPW
ncbi:MAG TPA: DinB family protein [Dehalococcoidia bacterium]|nr:DinB family protein [Dehalococcoidia bacterium]